MYFVNDNQFLLNSKAEKILPLIVLLYNGRIKAHYFNRLNFDNNTVVSVSRQPRYFYLNAIELKFAFGLCQTKG